MYIHVHIRFYSVEIRWAFGPQRVRARLAIFDICSSNLFDIGPWPGAIEPPRTLGDGGPERFLLALGRFRVILQCF